MGLISVINEFIAKRKEKKNMKLLEDRTVKELKEFVEQFTQSEAIEDHTEKIEKQEQLVKDLLNKVQKGVIDLGGTEEEKAELPLDIIKRHFKSDKPDCSEKVCETIDEMKKEEIASEIFTELFENPMDKLKIESLLTEYIELSGQGKKQGFMQAYSEKEKQDMLIAIMAKYKSGYEQVYTHNIETLYRLEYMKKIVHTTDIREQQRLYEEYITFFLNGNEVPEEKMVSFFSKAPFIIQREQKRICNKYGLEYDPSKPIKIYEATKENKAGIVAKNRELSTKKMQGEVTAKDFALVRTTNFLPRHRLVEPVGQHSTPLMDGTFFEEEILEAGLAEEDYKMAAFFIRETTHFTLNGLVGSHESGNFEGRNYIIIEPFEEQKDNVGLRNISAADTYFDKPVKLSKKAILLIPIEKYKEVCKDPKQANILSQYDVRVFAGDEELAVQMCLNEQGYVAGSINKWGFCTVADTPETKYCQKLQEAILQKIRPNENVTVGRSHSTTEHYTRDHEKLKELMQQRLDRFVSLLFEYSGVQFSEQYLKAMFKSRMYDLDEKHYKKYYEEYLQKTPEVEGVKHMSPKEVFEAIGPERVKEIIQIYNSIIYEEHKKARKARDKELLAEGLIDAKELEDEPIV